MRGSGVVIVMVIINKIRDNRACGFFSSLSGCKKWRLASRRVTPRLPCREGPMSAQFRDRTKRGGPLDPGQHLRAELKRLGLNQIYLSKAAGVSRQTVNNIVNGRHPIS